jgi:L-ribulose-5-phosphate 3-epimerase
MPHTPLLHIGIRAHDFGKLPAALLASRIAAQGLSCVQLALNKAIAGLNLVPGRGDLTPGLAWTIGRAFAQHNIQIAVLGCYINLSPPDASARAPLVAFFKEHLRHARDFGCGIVATESGSLNPDWSFHPANAGEEAFALLVPRVAELVEEAQRCGVIVGIEGAASHVLNSPQRIRRLLDAIRSQNLQVVFDPVNLLSPENYHDQDRILQESFDLFGDRIAILHAKDFTTDGPTLTQLPAGANGQGQLHYPLLLSWLQQHKPGINILLEESSEHAAAASSAFLQSCIPA